MPVVVRAANESGHFPTIASGLADRRKDFRRNPLLEPLRAVLPARQDQAVEAAFVDDHHPLSAGGGIDNSDTLLIVIKTAAGIRRVPNVECAADVREHEPGFAVADNGSELDVIFVRRLNGSLDKLGLTDSKSGRTSNISFSRWIHKRLEPRMPKPPGLPPRRFRHFRLVIPTDSRPLPCAQEFGAEAKYMMVNARVLLLRNSAA